MPGPNVVKECPHCSRPFRIGTLASAFRAPGPTWTDGRDPLSAELVEHLHLGLPLVKCPACHRLLWLEEARELGQMPFLQKHDSRWPGAAYYADPTEQDYLDALETHLAVDAEATHYLRVRAWWAANEPYRERSRSQPIARFSVRARKNLQCLADSLTESIEEQRLMKAELARELGLFDEAKRLLAYSFNSRYRHTVKVIATLVDQRQTKVALVRGDEGRTPEEIQALEDERIQRAAKQAALEAYFQIADQEHARKVAEGKACPRCGFSYAWTGKKCGHCYHEGT